MSPRTSYIVRPSINVEKNKTTFLPNLNPAVFDIILESKTLEYPWTECY